MPVSTQEVFVAECDAPTCNTRRPGTVPGYKPDGFEFVVKVTAEDGETHYDVEGYACRETHVGPAFRALLHKHGASDDDAGEPDGYIGGPDEALHDAMQEDAERDAERDAESADDDEAVTEADPALNGTAAR